MSLRNKRKSLCSPIFEPKRARKSEIRQQTSINDLPNEMLLMIFSYLRHDDILRMTLVNKNWNNLISNTQRLMGKINRIYIDDDKLQRVPVLTRRYETIQIDEVTEWKEEIFKTLKFSGSNVKHMTLFECVFFDDDFISLLKCCENLEELELLDCHPGISPIRKYAKDEKITLRNLKWFTLRGYSWPLRVIQTPILQAFEVESLNIYDQELLIKFLNQQTNLRSLQLVDIVDLFDSQFGILEPNFNLTELLLYDLPHTDSIQFLRMLNRVKSSVLWMDIGYQVQRDVVEYILKNFESLTSLAIDCDCLPNSVKFYSQLIPNENLKSVLLYGCVKSSKPILQFLAKHPRIDVLKMKALSNLQSSRFTFWNDFSRVTPNVTWLAIGNLESYNMVYLKSTKLVHLDVDFVGYTNFYAWEQFCLNNPNLEKFHIFRKQKYVDQEVENILRKNMPKLREICLEGSN